jgi:ketosteroid isomerase-like protein
MRTLQELNDLEDIRNLRLDYTHHFDAGRLDDLLALYTDDAVTDFGAFGVWTGKDEMRKGWAPYFEARAGAAPYTHGRHAVTNPQVSITGDTATANWFLIDISYFERHSTVPREQPIVLFGTYVDECKRVNGVWKLTRTTLHFQWPTPGGAPAGLIRKD